MLSKCGLSPPAGLCFFTARGQHNVEN